MRNAECEMRNGRGRGGEGERGRWWETKMVGTAHATTTVSPYEIEEKKKRVRWKKTGAAKQRESMRSRTPAWPLTSVP